jgi:hypothetical protein
MSPILNARSLKESIKESIEYVSSYHETLLLFTSRHEHKMASLLYDVWYPGTQETCRVKAQSMSFFLLFVDTLGWVLADIWRIINRSNVRLIAALHCGIRRNNY